ncbi:GNAT family N-acetyltransferase [Bergeyella sp. RCAD1439]|uniref:GNAT family N-acetyltransferase n=1 Tax=Bergeyella anatis TaxID=3113737 RepID=UPI002E19ACC8|nr:GNAT family N-acetyltransferase [Bergeyella sp. RCAD1439]
MKPIVTVRLVKQSEIRQLAALAKHTFSQTFSQENEDEDLRLYLNEKFSSEQLLSEWKNPESEFYFVETNGIPAGYLKINWGTAQTEKQQTHSMEIQRIYILQEHQGLGLGQLLLTKAIEEGKARQCNYLWLGVWEHNLRALKFYNKHHFEVFGQHDFILGKEVQTDLMLKLVL